MTELRPDNRSELVSLQEGARRLGLTTEALRMRLRRGQNAGEHHGRTWLVWLPREDVTEPDRTPTESDRTEADNRPDNGQNLTGLLDQLRTENAYLRAALEREQTASAELRRMLNLEQQTLAATQVRALPAPLAADMPADAAEGHQMPATPLSGVEWPDTSAVPAAIEKAAKRAGLGKKDRRRLVERLARLLHRS